MTSRTETSVPKGKTNSAGVHHGVQLILTLMAANVGFVSRSGVFEVGVIGIQV